MIHQDWDTPAFSAAALAASTGPFPRRDFLRVWWRHRSRSGDRLLLVEAGGCLLPLVLRRGTVEFLGEADLTDYHTPLGGSPRAAVAELAGALPPGTPYRFDSLPAEAAEPLQAALVAAGSPPARVTSDTARVLALPDSYDDHLAALGKKERHETRRKRRRFAAASGEPRLVRREGPAAVGEFAEMHRLSPGAKAGFMTGAMERFFTDLHTDAGGVVDAVVAGDGPGPAALAFGFENGDGYYLYNMAFDPGQAAVSPGAVLVTLLVERAIAEGRRFLDLLKGDEAYKARLGAHPRPLHTLGGVLGTGA